MDRYGGPDVLRCEERPRPPLREAQMLVEVHACGVCGHDLLARQGALGTSVPMVLGHEIAGLVAEVAADVEHFVPGQRVALVQRIPCGFCPQCRRGATNVCRRGPGFYGEDLDGGYSQYVVASPLNAVVLPEQIGFEQGAILSCGVGTGLRALRRADLHEDDVVVVTGAGGGVGMHTVALAALQGCRVLAVTSSEHKRGALMDAGATEVCVSPTAEELRRVAKELSEGRGAEAAIEIAGPPTFSASLSALAPGGRLVLVGNTEPRLVEINPGSVIVRELAILGSAHATKEDLADVVALVAERRIDPKVSVVAPLGWAGELHRAMEAREVTGRAVLSVAHSL